MSVLDTEVANQLVYRMLENGNADAAFPSLLTTMFTSSELIDSLNRVQQAFMTDTGLILTRSAPIPGVVGQTKYPLPTDNLLVRRVTWTGIPDDGIGWNQGGYSEGGYGGSDGTVRTRALTQADTWELDNAIPDWPYDNATPLAWWDTTLPQQTLGIAKAPSDAGFIGILYIALATVLTGLGVALTVPDDWTPYVLWGTIAELLGSDGNSFDPVRAQYARRRYDEGVELARLVLGGR